MWHEFTISLSEVHNPILEKEPEKSQWKSKISLNLTEIKRFYASFDSEKEKCVILHFHDESEDDLIVYETYKEVKQAMKPIMDKQNADS